MADYTILIADYDPGTTKFATEVFTTAGFEVQLAKDGLQAMEAFKKYRPVLTLIEFMMPKKAGLEVCRDLRHSPEGRDAHLVIMSSPFRGRAFRADAVRMYGASETVEKPLDEETLEGLLERLVRPRLIELLAATPAADSPPSPAPVPSAASAPVASPAAMQAAATAVQAAAAAMQAAVPAAQAEATAQALRDVVAAVLGPEMFTEIGATVADPAGPATAENNAAAKPSAPVAATAKAAFPPSVAEDSAGDDQIEDHIDSLLDF